MPDPNTDPNANPNPPAAPTAEDVANLQEALRKEREAHGSTSKQFKAIEKELNDLKNSGKSESDRIAARLKELEDAAAAKDQRIRESEGRDALRDAIGKAGVPENKRDSVMWSLSPRLEFGDDGKPTNVADLIKNAKELSPDWFRASAGKADAGAGNGGKPKNFDMNSQIRQMAGRGT